MPDILDSLLHEGASIDIAFGEPRPSFGDLFCVCGHSHPSFPPTDSVDISALADLQFDQVDDYFGTPSLGDEGGDVVVWLFPLVDGEAVHHHPGPFEGIRLEYCILRNSARHVMHFLRCVHELARFGFGVSMIGTAKANWERHSICRRFALTSMRFCDIGPRPVLRWGPTRRWRSTSSVSSNQGVHPSDGSGRNQDNWPPSNDA